MKIKQKPVTSYITDATPQELKDIDEVLKYRQSGYFWSKPYKEKRWDGYTHLFSVRYNTFPSGLVSYVEKELGKEFQIKKKKLANLTHLVTSTILKTKRMDGVYQYQQDAIRQMLRKEQGILHLATGSGKTYIAAAFCLIVNQRTLFLVHSVELMHQIKEVLEEETDLTVGLLGSGYEDIPDNGVLVAITNSVSNLYKTNKEFRKWIKGVQVVFADETHLAGATRYLTILKKCTGAYYRFGLSGTPLENDDLRNAKLIGALGPVISKVKSEELINSGVLAVPTVYMHTIDPYGIIDKSLSYPEAYSKYIVNCSYRNGLIAGITRNALAEGKTVLILVRIIEHGILLKELLRDRGVKTAFCCGQSESSERKEEMKKIKDGRSKVLILSKIGELGIDIPSIDVMVRAHAGKSTISTLQAIGRGLRKKEGDNIVTYHDFLDLSNKYLRKHSKIRKRDYVGEGFKIIEQ